MDRLDEYRDLIHKILSYYARLPYRYGEMKTYIIVDKDRNHFLLMHEGWEGQKRIHGAVFHAEIRDRKIWIHYDGIEDGIANELVAAGVPKDQIVLAFYSPEIRQHTGYAIA